MISKVYNLPEISFVGGETHDLRFHLFTDTGRVFNAYGRKSDILNCVFGKSNRSTSAIKSNECYSR